MLRDLVIDTNVLLHAQNPEQEQFAASQALLEALLEAPAHLCIDRGFDLQEAQNRSRIGAEYLEKLRFGSVGLAVLAALARNQRIKELPARPTQAVARRVNQIVRNKRDRTFLGVAYNSDERLLISHDFTDFQVQKRLEIRHELGIAVLCADECLVEYPRLDC